MKKIQVIGIGPGHRDYVLPAARSAVENSDILIGGRRNLKTFDDFKGRTFPITGDLKAVIDYIKENREGNNIAIILSGDTGFYSMLTYIKKHFSKDEIEVIPGITSLQYLFAKIKDSWQEAPLMSLHGREQNFLEELKKSKKVGLLTDTIHTPEKIAEILIESGLENTRMVVGEELSYPEERILEGKPEEIIANSPYKMSVVVIDNE